VAVSDFKLLNFYDPNDKKERCGLIIKHNRVIEVKNIHPQPELGFEIDPEAILRHEHELEGTWHTHPSGPATLSGEDYTCFLSWPHLQHYIIGGDGIVRRYIVKDGVILNDS
jgi:proteasome lid subunit RPN8/RPN11